MVGIAIVMITVVLSTTSDKPAEVVRDIELPPGMVATAMSLTMAGEHDESVLMSAGGAMSRYSWNVWRRRDPALLEYVDDQHAQLRVFPVLRDAPAVVVIDVVPKASASEQMVPYLGRFASLYCEPGLAPAPEPDGLGAALALLDAH